MPVVEAIDLVSLQHQLNLVRNICILAHVDHGKTTLADSLIASNGIISKRLAGKVRYLDNRKDEQERGITMKSSGITLYFHDTHLNDSYLINLIDSPGHVDFSNEVSAAVRLCDGAVIVVDVIEGVCPQTKACLEQAYIEHLQPVLILNKIDRLILDLKLKPLEAYYHVSNVLEQVNASLGAIFAADVLAKEDKSDRSDYGSAFDDYDDSGLYFTPANGNVVFASAVDGWAFSLEDFVKIYVKRLGVSRDVLIKGLWGDFYYHGKTKQALPGASENLKKPMFAQFILENIWTVYDTIYNYPDENKLKKIFETLEINITQKRISDPREKLRNIMSQWLPIHYGVLKMVVNFIPAPNDMTIERAEKLLFPNNISLSTYPLETHALMEDVRLCSYDNDTVIVFVAKMVPVHVSQLPANRPKLLTSDDLEVRREEVRRRIAERKRLQESDLEQLQGEFESLKIAKDKTEEADDKTTANTGTIPKQKDDSDVVFIAFARIFSGAIKPNMKLYCLSPKYDPRDADHTFGPKQHITEVTIGDLYLFMGGELETLEEVPAGNIVGIGGLENHILKTGTLSNSVYCTAFSEIAPMAQPVMRVAIEPKNPIEMPKLIKGLKLLNQADACVQVSIEQTGEHVITTLGEMHMEKCVRDLEESYAKIKVNVSKPMVSFRETIVAESNVDMVKEAIVKSSEDIDITKKIVTVTTTNKLSSIKMIALPIPKAAIKILEKYEVYLQKLSTATKSSPLSNRYIGVLKDVKLELLSALKDLEIKKLYPLIDDEEIIKNIWALGPRKNLTNILLNLSSFKHALLWRKLAPNYATSPPPAATNDIRQEFNSYFITGFNLGTSAGPLCEEPMYGVCFVVLDWEVFDNDEDGTARAFNAFHGQIVTAVKEACRQSFQLQPQRLVTPIYEASVLVDGEMLGRLYGVIARRHGRVNSGDLKQGTGKFTVTAMIPVVEAFNFVKEVRVETSGLANPQLMFSHWETIDIDPFWVPTTEEEKSHYGEKADSANIAKVYMDTIRSRKGLRVDKKIVEHAEKQRTYSRKK